MTRSLLLACTVAAGLAFSCASSPSAADLSQTHMNVPEGYEPSLAFQWMDVMLEAAARDVERVGAAPTILSRQMALPTIAMFEAWAAYDDVAVGPVFGSTLRRPEAERTDEAMKTAVSYAMYRTCLDQYPFHADYIEGEMRALGYDPTLDTTDPSTPAGLGNLVAKRIVTDRYADGANQLGDDPGSDGTPYSDTTNYRPVNTAERCVDPDRWQPIPFDDGKGGTFVVDFLTPHWHLVKPFGLESSDQFRPGPPPKVGSAQLKEEVDEVIAMNASLSTEQKALVEFMRDGPRSTGQSGHWLRFAQDVSVRDRNDFSEDVKLFFAVGTTAMDAFIASWDSKRYYDSSRPWTLVRHYYKGETLHAWGGPGKGVIDVPAEKWHPYSPSTFVTPPFPGYTSGHSTISGACAEMLRLYTGSDEFGVIEKRIAGALTEGDATCEEMQQVDGKAVLSSYGKPLSCDVKIPIPTFTEAAEIAGISRVLGGYHIQADNVAGLKLGRDVANYLHPKIQAYIDGTAE
ncbi:PAP2 superfamily protein [Planctomycetes bacterium Poly30]|uniref:PAP2 superfamily protein n=1 Tax=Saltatorellus ferox TaxID=2528018 RepID=A0A518EN85_9BACT|nr:PAP2 superfamily protein [Planctomycetes bacterium Poly30]